MVARVHSVEAFEESRWRREQLAKIRSYIDDGKLKEVRAAIEGLFTERTLRNWLADPTSAMSAHLVKKDVLSHVLERIEEKINDIDYTIGYKYALRELRGGSSQAHDLNKYCGNYVITSLLPKEHIDLGTLKIMITKDDIPLFIVKGRFGAYNKKNEGFVFDTGKNIILSGLSEYFNVFMVMGKVVRPNEDILHGVISLENRVSGEVYSSEVFLTMEGNHQMLKYAQATIKDKQYLVRV